MQNRTIISVIIPFFNAEGHIKNCLASLLKQKAKHLVEIIMVNDGSTDKSLNIIKSYRSLNIKLFQNKKNLGPAASRNLGLKFSSGDYIYFLDADDELESDALESFSKIFNEKKYDLVFTDKKRILNSQNLRENIYEYDTDKTLDNKNIIDLMKKRFFYPHESHRIFDLTGKFIKRDIILNNKISFDDELRYLEDECFMWSVLSFVNEAKYLKKQSYNYNIRHNESSGISEAFTKNFNITNFLKVKKQVEQSLEKKKLSNKDVLSISNQAYIFIIIGALISLTRSIMIGKIKGKNSNLYLKNIIKEIVKDKEIPRFAKQYKPFKNESRWIPKAIELRSGWLLEFFCKKRVKEILKKRKN